MAGMEPDPQNLVTISLKNSTATEALGARIAAQLRRGDVVCLFGALGAGKTTLARGLIRALAGEDVETPSPTYTLVQTYETPDFELWHADLYRLDSPQESLELGLEDAFISGACVIEWPERLGERLPPDRLEVSFQDAEGDGRTAELVGRGAWRERISDI